MAMTNKASWCGCTSNSAPLAAHDQRSNTKSSKNIPITVCFPFWPRTFTSHFKNVTISRSCLFQLHDSLPKSTIRNYTQNCNANEVSFPNHDRFFQYKIYSSSSSRRSTAESPWRVCWWAVKGSHHNVLNKESIKNQHLSVITWSREKHARQRFQ